MSGENELKPCFVPSCAEHSAMSVEIHFDNVYFAWCRNCDARGPGGNTRKEAVEGWNEIARATPPASEIVPEGLDLEKLSSALADVCTYIEKHEDLRPYSSLTPGKGLHTEILFFIAAIAASKRKEKET